MLLAVLLRRSKIIILFRLYYFLAILFLKCDVTDYSTKVSLTSSCYFYVRSIKHSQSCFVKLFFDDQPRSGRLWIVPEFWTYFTSHFPPIFKSMQMTNTRQVICKSYHFCVIVKIRQKMHQHLKQRC